MIGSEPAFNKLSITCSDCFEGRGGLDDLGYILIEFSAFSSSIDAYCLHGCFSVHLGQRPLFTNEPLIDAWGTAYYSAYERVERLIEVYS